MPKYINARKDDLPDEEEFRAMIRKLDDEDPEGSNYIVGIYETTINGKRSVQRFKIKVDAARAILSFLWLYGRRITEILLLDKSDIRFLTGEDADPEAGEGMRVMFYALKRKQMGIKRPKFVPHTAATATYIGYIMAYVKTLPFKECVKCNIGYNQNDPAICQKCGGPTTNPRVFPGRSWSTTKTRTFFSKKLQKEVTKTYPNYLINRMSEQLAWKTIKYLNPNVYNHLFRHVVTTRISRATNGDAFAMKRWNDWSSTKPAEFYVEGETMGRDVSTKMYGTDSRGVAIVRRCNSCGGPIRKGDRFCSKCGSEVQLQVSIAQT